jgi:Zn-dependent peptidase ImmA (M78 family)/transcriptional regulator with XRE-family HTH domain
MSKLNPQMVRLARESRGITQLEWAEAAKVAQGTISKLELGDKDVASETTERLAEAVHYPPSFFFLDEQYAGLGISILFFRKKASALQRYLRRLQALVNIQRIHTKILLRDVTLTTRSEIQRIDITEFQGTPADIANMVRAAWSIPAGPIRSLISVIENAGGFVFKFPFGTTDVDAISQWPSDAPPLFFVNSQAPSDRTRFSLAHELGHVVMHDSPSETQEIEANQFAAEFLMPKADIRPHLLEMNLQKSFSMKPHWRVSAGAIIKRAFDLGCMSSQRYTSLFKRYTQLGFRQNEPNPIANEYPQLVKSLVGEILNESGLLISDAAKMLHLYEDEFRQRYLDSADLRLAL